MAAALPAANLVNLLSLPARHFAVVDAGSQRARILMVAVARGRPRLVRTHTVDAHEDGLTTEEEMREEVQKRLGEDPPEAVVVVVPPHLVLLHVLDVPPTDAAQTRALVEREATSMGGLSESQWAFDSVRLRPFGRLASPLAAAFCRQDNLQSLLEGYTGDVRTVFDVRAAGDALAAAFLAAGPGVTDAILVDLGARHTGVAIITGGQAVFSTSFPSGSAGFTEALAADRGGTIEAAEVLKRTEPPVLLPEASPRFHAAVVAWTQEIERSVSEWREDHPDLAAAGGTWPVYVAGGGALQPGLVEGIRAWSTRQFEPWPTPGDGSLRADQVTAWGALLLALNLAGPAPSLLPGTQRTFWYQQRLWRGLASLNLLLAGLVALALVLGMRQQTRLLSEKNVWREEATQALEDARDIRVIADRYNARMEGLRTLLERQRQTVETIQLVGVLQRQRTNSNHWYVLLADAASYAAGSNHFHSVPTSHRSIDSRATSPGGPLVTNAPPSSRTFIAEVCLVPQGEEMRQALSDLVGDLKRYPLFRNVDVLPAERRHDWVATNLIFPERHFALELNLSESELLPSLPLPRLSPTNREPRVVGRLPSRSEPVPHTNGARSARTR